jgi:nitrogen fixation protein FixH
MQQNVPHVVQEKQPMTPQKTRTIWPYAIIAVFVLFAGYIGYMVQQAMRTTVDLVSPDYYKQELAYQKRMESVARTAALPAPVQLEHDAAAQRLTLQLPATLAGQPLQGQIHFFRPSDQKLDFVLPLQPTADLRQHLSTAKMQPGYWRIRLDFTAGSNAYFVEKELILK